MAAQPPLDEKTGVRPGPVKAAQLGRGRAKWEAIQRMLPEGWSIGGHRLLDFDAEQAGRTAPPLALPDAAFDLAWAAWAFTALAEDWAEWLLELHRLLGDDGVAVVRLGAPDAYEQLTDAAWDENQIGMTVLSSLDRSARPAVFHSEWWLRGHWGRAFDVLGWERREGHPWLLLRKRVVPISAAELRRPQPGEERELLAAKANSERLLAQLETLRRRAHARLSEELAAQREELHRELLRRSFEAADLEWGWKAPQSAAAVVASHYEATLSWRITRPLRAARKLLRRL